MIEEFSVANRKWYALLKKLKCYGKKPPTEKLQLAGFCGYGKPEVSHTHLIALPLSLFVSESWFLQVLPDQDQHEGHLSPLRQCG